MTAGVEEAEEAQLGVSAASATTKGHYAVIPRESTTQGPPHQPTLETTRGGPLHIDVHGALPG